MSDTTIISIGVTVIMGCATIIWYFVRRLISSLDRQNEVLDVLVDKVHNLDNRILKLEVLRNVS